MTPTTDRIRLILEDLEAVRENLLALSDDIWLSIDHNDQQALEEGVAFKRAYNDKMAGFDVVATELSALVQRFTNVRLESEEQTLSEGAAEDERLIAELDRETPHTLGEDMRYKRPYAFVLQGKRYTGVTTWRRVYELACGELLLRDRTRFLALPRNERFVSNRGNSLFSASARDLRSGWKVTDSVYAEVNLSANSICRSIRGLLEEFGIPDEEMRVFLREDRDAGRTAAAFV